MNAVADLVRAVRHEGFAFSRGLEVGTPLSLLGERLGRVLNVPSHLPGTGIGPVQTIRPRVQEPALTNQYSGTFGLGEFPLHTDLAHWALPPRYLLLRCQVGADAVSTLVLPFAEVTGSSGIDWSRALVRPRRRQGGSSLLRICFLVNDRPAYRWDPLFLRPANATAHEAAEVLEGEATRAKAAHFVLEREGDMLLLDNWQVLHGRSRVPDGSLGRVIERVYIEELSA